MKETSKFKIKKLENHCVESLQEIRKEPIIKSTIIASLKKIPIVGEYIDSSIEKALTEFQRKKQEELIDMIIKSKTITSDDVNDMEFLFNFAKTLEAVNRLATNDKVKFFANLLKNGYLTKEKISCDEFDEYLNILNRLSFREIEYLWFLYNYQTNNFGKEKEKHNYFINFGIEFSKTFNCDKFDYIGVYDKLTATGCVEKYYIAYPGTIQEINDGYYDDYQMSEINIGVDYYYISENFIKFIRIIKQDTNEL